MTNDERGTDGTDLESLYRLLPSLHDLLLTAEFGALLQSHSRKVVVSAARATLAQIRHEISDGQHTATSLVVRMASLADEVATELVCNSRFSLQPVINATGVILHTNLGRAPLGESALHHLVEVARGYCNLELDLESGERSRRDVHAQSLILRLLRMKTEMAGGKPSDMSQAVVVVNNCAAATFLALNTLADGAEVVVSRGELVEIGGGFRVPEILEKSGALLREVGTTNKTRVSDYESAISPNTALLLRVHQSNFSVEGFTSRPKLEELVSLGQRRHVPVFEDQGTGLVFSLERHGIKTEETLLESFCNGADLIAASGDKLLGGPQCGILVGREDLIERIRRNPLLRTFRVDKLTYAALEATLMDHMSETADSIPIVSMLNTSPAEILRRCHWVAYQVRSKKLSAEVVSVMGLIGGGTAPGARLPSSAVSLRHVALGPQALLHAMRRLQPPVIARISDDRVLLDLRTVEPEFDGELARMLQGDMWALSQMSRRS
ncbi:MAG TPA: L-seryl-tRNA(Sec) selenium transferase [Acidobacteriaceae bacterium]|nr:L-seryl-tRNA(Sec) selenium transferase [Acidobacteriaceae bacterium]